MLAYAEDVDEKARSYAKAPGSAGGRRASRDFTCEHCGREFNAKPVHDRRGVSLRRFCSKRCAGAQRTVAAKARQRHAMSLGETCRREAGVPEKPAELIEMSAARPLTPAQSAKIRCHILGLLRVQIPLAHRVVLGEVAWSATQARIFTALLEKCVPNLSAGFAEIERQPDDFRAMSRYELEALAAAQDAEPAQRSVITTS